MNDSWGVKVNGDFVRGVACFISVVKTLSSFFMIVHHLKESSCHIGLYCNWRMFI